MASADAEQATRLIAATRCRQRPCDNTTKEAIMAKVYICKSFFPEVFERLKGVHEFKIWG
ncbi:MAG: hypothetical protein IMY84_06065, partial [Chloroflexi bacterium]|nr:hypothetical protein [Chloroflexota bacterium]